MVTNLNNYGKQIRFMLSTDDPTAVEWQNGDLVFLMDRDQLYVFDADNSTFKEISMGGGGGGGGGPAAIEIIQELTLSQDVRAVQVDIPAGYDWVYLLIKGEFTAEDWLYWAVNANSGNDYSPKLTNFQQGVVVMVTNQVSSTKLGVMGFANTPTYTIKSHLVDQPLSYLYLYGYSHDMKSGTKVYTYGGKYASM